MELVATPELDRRQAQRLAFMRNHQAGVHQDATADVKVRTTGPGWPCWNLLDDSDRLGVFMSVGQLCRVMQDQNWCVLARPKPLPRGSKMPGQNVRFADPLIGEKAICRLGVRPIFGRPGSRRTYSTGELLQQMPKPLAMATSSNSHPTTSLSIHSLDRDPEKSRRCVARTPLGFLMPSSPPRLERGS
jgi:hypothetical protein